MEIKHVEYIQDIAFNDTYDKMAISTTSQKIIIYQKVYKKSHELIVVEKEEKENVNEVHYKSPKQGFHNTISFSSIADKKKLKRKEVSNINLPSKFNRNKRKDFNLNDSVELKNRAPSSRSVISIESDDSKKNRINKEQKDEEEDTDFFFSRSRNSNFFKSINFGSKNKFKLDRINISNFNDQFEDSFDSLYNSSSILKHSKIKEYEYRWEKVTALFIDGPALKLQWARSEFGNILACSGYNKCVNIFKEEKLGNNINWKCSAQIKEFTHSVEDITFLPEKHSLVLAAITSDGLLRIFIPLNNDTNWQSKQSLKVSDGCTSLCCNPSILDKYTIVIGCKKKSLNDDLKNEKRQSTDNLKMKEVIKKKDSIINNKFKDLIKIVYFRNINDPLMGSINESGHEDDITDVDWANRNGRTHHMICSTSKDGKFIIWEINLLLNEMSSKDDIDKINNNFFSYKKLFEYNNNKPLWRCNFNESGVMVSCIDEDGEVFVFFKIGRSKFIKLDIHKKK